MSLEAKAGIVGAVYAFERLMAASSQRGTALANFNSLLGVSTKELQQYQYAARQVGASNEEMESTFKGLQSTATKALIGKGAPAGLGRVAQLTGDISQKELLGMQQDPAILLQRLQEYAQKEKNAGLRNENLRSFGLSDNIIVGLTKGAFSPGQLNKAPTYSEGQIGQLNKANIAWSNLGNKIEMAVGKFNAKHGNELVDGISKVVPEVLKLVEALTTLAEKLKIFEAMGKVFEGWSKIFNLTAQGVDAVAGAANDPKKRKALLDDTLDFAKSIPGVLSAIAEDITPRGTPQVVGGAPGAHISVSQTITHHGDAKDTQAVKDTHRMSLNHALRTNPATQGGY